MTYAQRHKIVRFSLGGGLGFITGNNTSLQWCALPVMSAGRQRPAIKRAWTTNLLIPE